MGGKHDLRFAIAAFIAGLTWGYLRHRRNGQAPLLALLQGLEWFIAYGGAATLIESARRLLKDETVKEPQPERISHFREVVTERTGTEG